MGFLSGTGWLQDVVKPIVNTLVISKNNTGKVVALIYVLVMIYFINKPNFNYKSAGNEVLYSEIS